LARCSHVIVEVALEVRGLFVWRESLPGSPIKAHVPLNAPG